MAKEIRYSDLFKYLPEFMIAAKALSFNDASKLLYTSRSSLSRHMSEMEKAIGIQLFERNANSLSLTENGTFLYNSAKMLYSQAQDVLSSMQSRMYKAASLNISIANCYFPELFNSLYEFRNSHPEIAYTMFAYDLYEILENVKSGISDAAVTFDFTLFGMNTKGLNRAVLSRSNYVIIMAEKHPLSKKEKLFLSDIEPYEVMLSLPVTELCDRLNMNQLDHEKTIGMPVPLEFSTPPGLDYLMMNIKSSSNLAFLPEPVARYAGGHSVIKKIEDVESPFDIVFLYRSNNKNPSLRLLIDGIRGNFPVKINYGE